MSNNKFEKANTAQLALQANKFIDQAALDVANSTTPQLIRKVTIPLDNERSSELGNLFQLNYPFQSVYVESTTDSTVVCDLIPYGNEDGIQGARLRQNDVLGFDLPVLNFAIANPAQPNKKITLYFFLYSNLVQGSTNLNVDSFGNNINIGGATISNFLPGIQIRRTVNMSLLAPLASNAFRYFHFQHANYFSNPFSANSNVFYVPAGYEMVITGVSIYNLTAETAITAGNLFAYLGVLNDTAANDGTDTSGNESTYFEQYYGISFPFGPDDVFKSARGIAEIPNPCGFTDNLAPNPKKPLVVPAGKRLAFMLTNFSGSPAASWNNITFDLVGIIREAV